MCASKAGLVDLTRVLIVNGADINIANANSFTSLMKASFNGHADVARVLVTNGANHTLSVLLFIKANGDTS